MLDNLISNQKLSSFSTFKIGGTCSLFYKVNNIKELKKFLNICKQSQIRYQVLGNGSNILFDDEPFKGAIIYFGTDFSLVKQKRNFFKVQSGMLLSKLVIETTKLGYQGLEKLIGIPASIGGALYGNAGCNDSSISDYLISVKCLVDGKIKKYRKKDLLFSYRDSLFKHQKNIIILEAIFKLKKYDKNELFKTMRLELKRRKEMQPNCPNIGCIFKNGNNYNAGKIIEECGLKGYVIGGARVSEKHANIIENFNNASSKDVKELIEIIKKEVWKQKRIKLKEEIIIWS